jgi:hypothetical protein
MLGGGERRRRLDSCLWAREEERLRSGFLGLVKFLALFL